MGDCCGPIRVSYPEHECAREWWGAVRAFVHTQCGVLSGGCHDSLGRLSLASEQVGRLLNALDDTGQASNTIVVFTTDHGEHHEFAAIHVFTP